MKLSRNDAAVSAAVFLGAAALVTLFVADLNAVSGRKGEKELGSVVFKKLTATRKGASGFGWELMRNNCPVYNADTLRTSDFSEATVYFSDGTSLDMLENSMLKLDFGGKTKNLEFLSGEIGVGSSKEAVSYTISSAAGKINIDKGAKAVFTRDADKLSVEVSQGSAKIVKADGSSQTISQNQELQVDVKSGAAAVVARPIIPIAPERNGRLLSFAGGGKTTVEFAWQLGAAQGAGTKTPAKTSYNLELSQSRDFASAELSTRADGLSTRVELGGGIWYWRVRDADGRESPTRRFSLELAETPRPAFPPDGRRYEYRRIKPEVAFAWTAMEGASAYLFEISSEPNFAKPVVRSRTMTANLSVNSVGEGLWYWRVSPIHAYTLVGAPPAARVGSFTITQRTAMGTPALTAPIDASLYQIQDIDGKGLDFSWIPEAEAVSYELLLSKTKDLSAPVLKAASTRPYLRLSGGQAEALKVPGSYFWGVRWIDKEGNASPPSASRALQGVDGSIAVRLSFPPQEYRVADSLIQNTRFAWKSNVGARTVFQLSRDAEFRDLVYQETVSADTLIGRPWKSGRYFWRLCTYNADGSIFLKTEPRTIEVVEPFAGPALINPAQGSAFYLREQDSATFSWAPTANADYYSLILRSSADNYAVPVFEKNFQEEPKLVYPLGKLPGGAYRLSIQAFAVSGEKTTRVIGYIGESDFRFKQLSYIKLESPAEGEHLDGLDARKGKSVFAYNLEDKPNAAEIVVSTDPAGANVIARSDDRSGRGNVGRLAPGTYYWTVTGTLAGFDVSAKERLRFEVDQPPPPPAPALAAPVDGTFYRIQDIDGKGLDFSWAPESEAASYELIVSKGKDLSAPFLKISTDQARARVAGNQAAPLKQPGAFYWGVRWTNRDNDVSVLSPARRLQGVDGVEAVRPAFPPDGYRLSEQLVRSSRFLWKSELRARTVFQFARDPGFLNPVYEGTAENVAVIGQDCRSGRYYWRIRTYNADGSVFLETQPRSVDIVDPFPAPTLLKPVPGNGFYLREHDTAVFSWNPVAGAERYNLILRSAADNYASIALQKDSIDGTSFEYRLGDLRSGTYRLSIQAVAEQSGTSSRIEGRAGENEFRYKRLSYAKLLSPSAGEHVGGLDARRGKTVFAYEFADRPDMAEVIVSADQDGAEVAARRADRSGRTSVGRLAPGVYYWTVAGTFAGFDLSAKERVRFVVDQPPLLPAPEILQPERETVIGPIELRKKRSILFSWKPVDGATHYRLAVFAKGKKEPIFAKDKIAAPSLTVEDLSVLDKGRLTWTVEARSFDERGELEQSGRESGSMFTIDLPAVKKASTDKGEKLYGR